MNSRAFLWFLIIVIVALIVGWFVLIRPSAPSPAQEANIATSTATVTPAPTEPTPETPALDPAVVVQNIVGNWVSTDDSNYTVQITSKGKWTDTYKGSDKTSASQTGTYTLFTSKAPDKDFTGVLVPGVVYLKVVEGKSTLYYSVLTASTIELQISYLDRGNTLSFVRVQ